MLDEYSTVSVVVIDTVVNALLYILSGLFIIKGEFRRSNRNNLQYRGYI